MAVITCPHCGAAGNAPDQILGQQVRCSKCKQSFVATNTAENVAPPPIPTAPLPAAMPVEDDLEPARPPTRERSRRAYEDDYDDGPRRSPRRGPSASGFVDFLMFRKMLAPILIMVVFWVGIVFMLIGGMIAIVAGLFSRRGDGPEAVFGGLIILILGPIVWRVFCEVLIVIFRLNETLTDIKNELDKKN